MGTTIAPDHILKELSALWADTGKQGQAEGGAGGMLRACSMTLLVMAEASEDTQGLGETLAALMPEHPARAIVIRLSGEGERSLTERVYSQCWMPFGQRRQVCCEQVEITVSDAGLDDLRSVVLPLTVPDLPLIVWCRSPRASQMEPFRQIAKLAQKVVLDTSAGPAPVEALVRAEALSNRGILLGDLSWTRLTRWREMLAQVFENHENAVLLKGVAAIEVKWGGTRQVPALYLGAWVRDSLGLLGVSPQLTITRAADQDFLHVRLTGEGLTVELERQDERMIVTLNGGSQCTNLPKPTDYLLLREELSIVRRDPVFEKALASAARLSYPTEK